MEIFHRSSVSQRVSPQYSGDLPRLDPAEGLNYNNIFLALSITFMVLTSFERKRLLSYSDFPSWEVEKYQILSLGIALSHVREYFLGHLEGKTYRGLEFLSRLASAYGVRVGCHSCEDNPFLPNDQKHQNPSLPEIRKIP